jgi:hypothetical protein
MEVEMSRLILDSNQSDPIRLNRAPRDLRVPPIVIPLHVWDGLLIGAGANARRRAIAKYELQFGMDMPTIFGELAERSEDRIRNFDPVYHLRSPEHAFFAGSFEHPYHSQRHDAEQFRQSAAARRQNFEQFLKQNRKKLLDTMSRAKQRGETVELVHWDDILAAEEALFGAEDAPYRRWFIGEVTTTEDGGSRPIAAKSAKALFDAAWENPMIRRFLRVQALVVFGYLQGVWADDKLNVPLALNRNDDTDMSLALYARPGDIILTSDGRAEYAIHHADVAGEIQVMTWLDWRASQTTSAVT